MVHQTTVEVAHKPSVWANKPGYKPLLLLIAAIIFGVLIIIPPPRSMIDLVSMKAPQGYKLGKDCNTITDTINKKLRSKAFKEAQTSDEKADAGGQQLMNNIQAARLAKIMISILLLAAFLWGTEALTLGATDVLVAVLLYLFCVLPVNEIGKAYMKDAVFFIFGILAVAVGVAKTGLDKRIGLILLSRIKSAKSFALLFLPVLGIFAGFLSEHALVALLIPVLMGVYKVTCKMHGVEKDRALAVFLLLGLCFAANHGGPGSPAAGGRNAIMVGYLMEYGTPISFLQWMKCGLPFVPVMGVFIGIYMYLRCKPKFLVKDINPSEIVKAEVAKMPKFGGKEAQMAIILVCLILGWIIFAQKFGLGGTTLIAVAAMFICRIIDWDNLQEGIAFDVVGLYAAACAMGVGLKFTGGALWLASTFVNLLPDCIAHGDGLVMGVSLLTGTMTNFMSDGATVAALGPIVLPMADLAHVHVWKVGLICAFSSSFANFLVVGTPNNAIAFGMGKDPETGEKLLTVFDFMKYGLPVTIMAWLILWGWAVFGYWKLMSWPVPG